MSRGTSILVAAAAAALVLPLGALGLGLPLWIDGALATSVFGGLYLVLRRPSAPDGIDVEALDDARSHTARGLTADAAVAVEKLRQISKGVEDVAMRGQITSLWRTGDKVLKDVRADPSKAMAVRRLLTFYLPTAASLAEGWRALEERSTPPADRVEQTRQTMQSLNEAFTQYADNLTAPQMQTLDLDLKVLNDALKADLEAPPALAPPEKNP